MFTFSVFVDSDVDPVNMFLLYRSKLDERCDKLWQKPKQGIVNYIDLTWYESRVVGHGSSREVHEASV